MSPEILAHLLKHIGGSAKRNLSGASLGITSKSDPNLSPGGRRLIGKIGIGLFSVSQLTHTFQIITKLADDDFRTVASVILRQYADTEVQGPGDEDKRFESGKVSIWREKASDRASHGTTIVLTSIRRQARDILRSKEIWDVVDHVDHEGAGPDDATGGEDIEPPKFHIGRMSGSADTLRQTDGSTSSLPWAAQDDPKIAFEKLVAAVWRQVAEGMPNPQLSQIFDYYLRAVWQLSLSVPVPYIQGHLFDEDVRSWAHVYLLSNDVDGQAERIHSAGVAIREKIPLVDRDQPPSPFAVYFDGLQLFRPLMYRGLPRTSNALKHSLAFIGKCRETFERIPSELSGGPLSFEAYLFWNPKVAPVEHQGSLVRIHGSSGTLFDPTFMRYQVAEQTRLRQITCEIFVHEGLDSALNIDRESFNLAHPHAIYITRWLHGALRQLATTQKRLASEIREQAREESKDDAFTKIHQIARATWRAENNEPGSRVPVIKFAIDGEPKKESDDAYVLSREAVFVERSARETQRSRARSEIQEEKLKAIAQVLAAFGILDRLSAKRQQKLLRALFEILISPEV